MNRADLERMLFATAAALDLRIAAEHQPGVLDYLALAAAFAEQLEGVELEPHDEPAVTFRPIE